MIDLILVDFIRQRRARTAVSPSAITHFVWQADRWAVIRRVGGVDDFAKLAEAFDEGDHAGVYAAVEDDTA